MASHDLHNNIEPQLVNNTQIDGGNTLLSLVGDLLGFESAEFVLSFNLIAATQIDPDTTVIKIQESDDNVVFTDVALDEQLGTPIATGIPIDDRTYRIGYIGKKRYIRLSSTAPSGVSQWRICAFLIKANPLLAPTADNLN